MLTILSQHETSSTSLSSSDEGTSNGTQLFPSQYLHDCEQLKPVINKEKKIENLNALIVF
jgi:hypothetical protein